VDLRVTERMNRDACDRRRRRYVLAWLRRNPTLSERIVQKFLLVDETEEVVVV
jgi:hypothetical protein